MLFLQLKFVKNLFSWSHWWRQCLIFNQYLLAKGLSKFQKYAYLASSIELLFLYKFLETLQLLGIINYFDDIIVKDVMKNMGSNNSDAMTKSYEWTLTLRWFGVYLRRKETNHLLVFSLIISTWGGSMFLRGGIGGSVLSHIIDDVGSL